MQHDLGVDSPIVPADVEVEAVELGQDLGQWVQLGMDLKLMVWRRCSQKGQVVVIRSRAVLREGRVEGDVLHHGADRALGFL